MMKRALTIMAIAAAAAASAAELRFTPADDPAHFAEAARAARASAPDGRLTVSLAAGVYRLAAPLRLGSGDSHVTWRGEGAGAVFSGGVEISGWREEGDGTWSAPLPRAPDGAPLYFEQLFVDGRRAARARLPDAGFFTGLEEVRREFEGEGRGARETTTLKFGAADYAKLAGMAADDVPYAQILCNFNWDRLRCPLGPLDDGAREVVLKGPKMPDWCHLKREDLYAFENVRAAFDAPGEWFYDGPAGRVRYRPIPGERLPGVLTFWRRAPRFVAPAAMETLLEVRGDAAAGRYVDGVVFENVAFEHSAPVADAAKGPSRVEPSQSAVGVCAATVVADGARGLAFRGCAFRHTGSYALWFREGCKGCEAVHCEMTDLGAGGVRIGVFGSYPGPDGARPYSAFTATSTESNRVDDCIIRHGGRFHPACSGVIVGHASDNTVTHNEISDLYYTGVSVGWVWGYAGSVAQRNEVSYNRIHHLGQGQLADLGGVYTLGSSFGTRIANNVIHDVDTYSYGGWGIYADEGSEGSVWENNLVYNTEQGGFHCHYGRALKVRNNVFADSALCQLAVTRCEPHRTVDFERNIVYWRGGADDAFARYPGTCDWERGADLGWERNLWWHEGGEVRFCGHTFDEWRARGRDVDGAVADPKFADAGRADFTLAPDSPALALGFVPIDYSEAGVRAGDREWRRKAEE